MSFDELLQLQLLKRRGLGRSADSEPDGAVQLRQMCAKVPTALYGDLERVCEHLGVTKRLFIESAVSDAIKKAMVAIADSRGQKSI